MSNIYSQQISIDTVGSAGAAAGTGHAIGISGFLLDVYLNYHASCPNTADVTITDPIFGTVLSNANSATDTWLMPRKQSVDLSASATGMYELVPINETLTISVAQAAALTACLVVTLRWMTL
jgi:hypothetical protein